MPDISVIMGVKNGGRFLAEAFASLQAQTWTDWELVLVENGSNDGAVDALQAAVSDPRLRILRFPEALLPGGSLAAACEAATGRYVAVLDHDDLALPRRLELQRNFLDAQSELVLAGVAVELIDAEGRPLELEPFVGLHEDIHAMTAFVHVLRHSGIMFRRELLGRVGYRVELGLAADFDFIARATEAGRVGGLPVVLCRYRLHGDSMSGRERIRSAVDGALARMLTRRRRRGQDEGLSHWREIFGSLRQGSGTLARAHLGCAEIFRRERHPDLASLHAWLAWRAGGGWAAATKYARVVAGGLGGSRSARHGLLRAWLKEPAHQLLRVRGMPDRMQF